VRRPRGRGAVTAELATAVPAVVLLSALLVWTVTLVAAQLRCLDAAREAARALARHESRPAAVGLAREVAPSGARVAVSESAGRVRVVVTASTRAPGWLGGLPPVQTSAAAVAAAEPR
jgi:hypothetical protein